MKKITKKENNTFIKTCEKFLEDAGGQKVEKSEFYYESKHYIFESDTLGKLAINIDKENNGSSIYSIYAKFENEKLAKEYFDCNPYSGKYNLHTRHADAPMIWLERLLYQFNNLNVA